MTIGLARCVSEREEGGEEGRPGRASQRTLAANQ